MHCLRGKQVTPVDKLAFIGSRGMGALEFRPAVPLEQQPAELPLADLYRLSQRMLDRVTQVLSDWLTYARRAGVPEPIATRMAQYINTLIELK